MTRRISPVAVCCSRDSVSSRFRASSSVNSRTFSMAMTAWSASVWSRADLRPRRRARAPRAGPRRPDAAPLAQHGRVQLGSALAGVVNLTETRRLRAHVRHAHRRLPPEWRAWRAPDRPGSGWSCRFHGLHPRGRPTQCSHRELPPRPSERSTPPQRRGQRRNVLSRIASKTVQGQWATSRWPGRTPLVAVSALERLDQLPFRARQLREQPHASPWR